MRPIIDRRRRRSRRSLSSYRACTLLALCLFASFSLLWIRGVVLKHSSEEETLAANFERRDVEEKPTTESVEQIENDPPSEARFVVDTSFVHLVDVLLNDDFDVLALLLQLITLFFVVNQKKKVT